MIYRRNSLAAIDVAITLLRPGAKFQLGNNKFTIWDDPRPEPSWEEVLETIEKIRAFESSINTIYLEDYQ